MNLARDRTEVLGGVYMGMTTGCAMCHDHKYDPLTMKDFYALSAFFNNVAEKASGDDRDDWPPSILIPEPGQSRGVRCEASQRKETCCASSPVARAKADELIASWIKAGGPKAVSTDGLELRLPLDENYRHGDADRTVLHNTAPSAKPKNVCHRGPRGALGRRDEPLADVPLRDEHQSEPRHCRRL